MGWYFVGGVICGVFVGAFFTLLILYVICNKYNSDTDSFRR